VDVPWSVLDNTRETMKEEIEKDMEEMDKSLEEMERIQRDLSERRARIARNKKTLKLADKRAEAKTICLHDELEFEQEQERIRNGGLSDGEVREAVLDLEAAQAAQVAGASTPLDWSAWDVSGETGEPGLVPLGGS